MIRRVLIVNGHPDPNPERLCAALCDAYAAGASLAGIEVRRLDIGLLDLPPLRTAEAFIKGELPPDARTAQDAITWAEHLVIVHPLWLGSAPALLKAFAEQVFRYGFALSAPGEGMVGGLLRGRSARLIVTMGMPAAVHRLVFGAFGVRSFERGVLWLSGFKPIRRLVLGGVEGSPKTRARWLAKVRALGERGA